MSLIVALCHANKGVLQQKLGLLNTLVQKHGADKTAQLYQKTCPIVHATIGQHFRHSLDHVQRATEACMQPETSIHYDLRQRNTPDEHDFGKAVDRINSLLNQLEEIEDIKPKEDAPVKACFMLSGDDSTEYFMQSTTARELGFAAHHAIHHLAMVKVIATCSAVGELAESDLPHGFGRAPSTLYFENKAGTT